MAFGAAWRTASVRMEQTDAVAATKRNSSVQRNQAEVVVVANSDLELL